MTMESTTKRHSITAILSITGSALLIIGVLWGFAKPWVATAVAEELKTQVTEIVNEKVAPLNAGLRALLDGNIENLRRRIQAEEFRRSESQRNENDKNIWTLADEQALNDMTDELEIQKSALQGMVQSSRKNGA